MICLSVLPCGLAVSVDDEDRVEVGARIFVLRIAPKPVYLGRVVQIRQHAQRVDWSVIELDRTFSALPFTLLLRGETLDCDGNPDAAAEL